MLMTKTETYKFISTDKDAPVFIKYMKDKYEWGGAEVKCETIDGLTSLSITYFASTDELLK